MSEQPDCSGVAEETIVCWSSKAPATDAQTEQIQPFSARGMVRVYGRGDYFGRSHSFNMDIWMTREGRLLMRCSSRCTDIDGRSFEIKGVNPAGIPVRRKGTALEDTWVPASVRAAYDEWIRQEF